MAENVQLDDEIVLPTTANEAEVNPSSLLIFGKEKCGKTTALAQLEDCLIIDTEKGATKVKSLSIQVPDNVGPVGKMLWLKKLARKLIAEGRPYKRIAVDTLTEINEWAEWSGTFKYMNSPQGKSFNRVKDKYGNPIKGGDMLDPDDPDYQSVHTIPEGYGYRWSRAEVIDLFNLFMDASSECTIFVCHIEDKYVAVKDTTSEVVPKQLALTGQLRNILPRKVDGIGYISNKNGTININFKGSEEKLGGIRSKHLIGYDGPLDWSKVFI